MPRDDNKQPSINNKSNNISKNNKSQQSSSGSLSSSPDDALLRHSGGNKNPIKSTNNNSNGNIKSNKNATNKSGGSNLKDKALNAASKAPVVGKYAQAAKLALNGVNALKNMVKKKEDDTPEGIKNNQENRLKNAFGLLGAGVGLKSLLDGKGDSSKENSNKKNKDSGEGMVEEAASSGIKSVAGFLPIVIAIVIIVTVIVIVAVFFLLFSGEKISSYRMNYISSTVRGEELIEGDLDFFDENTLSDEERHYIDNLNDIYNSNGKNFNPDLVSSTFQVMMDYAKDYHKDGKFNYADFNANCNFFTKKLNFGGLCRIKDLADRLKGSQVESGNIVVNKSNTPTVEGVAAVASDAGTAVGNLPGGFGRNEPANLVNTGRVSLDNNGCWLTADAWAAFQVMEQAAAADGVTIGVNSCYRSYDEQAGTTGNSPASAGYSEHQMGSTIDIANHDSGLIDNPTVNSWLYTHAAEYGFINRYYNMSDETHHFRFVGNTVAAAYGKYNTSAPGARPYYTMSYEDFVNSDEGRSVIGSSSTSSTSKSKSSSSSNKSTTSSSNSNNSASGAKVVEIATAEVGQKEDASGVTKYGQWYGIPNAEWCAAFVAWVANQAGVSEDIIPKTALPSAMKEFFVSKGQYHAVGDGNYTPQPGDIAIYDRGHVGIVAEYNASTGQIKTIDGNSGAGEDSVAIKEGTLGSYPLDISGFAHPAYANQSVSSQSNKNGNINNDENYRETIKEFILEQFDKDKISDERADRMVTEIFEFKNDYYDLIGKEFEECGTSSTSSAGSCTYDIKGFVLDGGSEKAENLSISNLKVRLMQCSDGTYGQPVPGEELVDFEKYILGVTYAEVGTDFEKEGAKAEAIAARSYALARPSVMHSNMGTGLVQEDGQWILQLRACTDDQVYCDPDRGCSMDSSDSSRTHYSGTDHAYVYKEPLPADAPLRSYVAETNGQVLVNSKDYIVSANYLDVDQRQWNSLALQGNDVTQILIPHYASKNATNIKSMPCNGGTTSTPNPKCNDTSAGVAASGPYTTWRQFDERWGSESLGDSDIATIGCTATSMAILIAKSGVKTNVTEPFDPGSFVRAMKAQGGFDNGNYVWSATSRVVPGFQEGGFQDATLSTLPSVAQNLINQGYYGTAWVGRKGYCHHWIAVDRVENGKVYMIDPASDLTEVTERYNVACGIHYFKLS